MSDENTQADETKKDETTATDEGDKKEKTEVNKFKEDMFKYKKESKSLAEENQKLKDQLKKSEEEKLKSTQNYKELYERKAQEVEEFKQKWQQDRQVFFNTAKLSEIEKQALALGIRKEALGDLSLLDTSSVITETTSTGNLNVLGAKEFVESIKQARPYWFKDVGEPNINTGRPTTTSNKALSAEEILKLQKTDPERYRQEVLKRLKK